MHSNAANTRRFSYAAPFGRGGSLVRHMVKLLMAAWMMFGMATSAQAVVESVPAIAAPPTIQTVNGWIVENPNLIANFYSTPLEACTAYGTRLPPGLHFELVPATQYQYNCVWRTSFGAVWLLQSAHYFAYCSKPNYFIGGLIGRNCSSFPTPEQCPTTCTLSGQSQSCPVPTINPAIPYTYNPATQMCEREQQVQYTISLHNISPVLIEGEGLGGEMAPNASRNAYANVGVPGVAITLTTAAPFAAGSLTLSPHQGSSGVNGRLNFIVTAPSVGGTHTVTATCDGGKCSNQATETVVVTECTIPDLPPITDTEVQLFESNPDRSDETRLTDRMKEALACLKRDAAAGSPNVGSAYRPPAYNQHLIDVWEKWDELKNNAKPACAALKTKIQGHFKTHKLKESQGPVPGSRHTLGEAVDVTISLPPATIDAFWPGCHLYRPPSLRITDPVHFIYK